MQRSLFDFTDYQAYLKEALPTHGKDRGARVRLADSLGIQKGFISSVLYGNADFSLEQSYRVSQFLGHTQDEREFFLLLVQMARAGSKDLREHFKTKIDEILTRRREIRERIAIQAKLSEMDQLLYYSSWHYTAVHMCLRVPALQTASAMAQYLGLPVEQISRVLEFFIKTGLAEQQGNHFIAGPTRIHIGSDSPFVSKHHTNWRMQAIAALDRVGGGDLHYSLVMSISKDAAEKIREILLSAVQAAEPVIRDAKDEGVFTLAMDLFEMRRSG